MHEVDIYFTIAGSFKIVGLEHMQKMKTNAIIGNTGHLDNAS